MKTKTLLCILAYGFILYAQETISNSDSTESSVLKTIGSGIMSNIKLTGEAGVYGEYYTISGKSNRKPPQTGRLFFRPSISIFDNFSISFDMFLSTEGNAARQQMSTISLHPTWGWSKWHFGDFGHELSRFTMSGISLRGGGVELYPGWFRFQLVGGQSQRAVSAGYYGSMYARNIAAGKIGFGSETSYFDFMVVRAKDDIRSLPRDVFMKIDTIRSENSFKIDTSMAGTTPQENLVIGWSTAFQLFGGAFSFRGDAAGSIFTKDLNSKLVDSKELPDGVDKIFKPRMSSNADFAYVADIGLNLRVITARVDYSVIGPGYTSMGLASVINDKKSLNSSVGFNLFEGALSVQGNYQTQRDNLVKQKLFTTQRNAYGISTSMRPFKILNVSINTTYNTLQNNPDNDTLKIDNSNISFNTNASIQLPIFGVMNSISTTFGTQTYKDQNILRRGNDVNSINMNLSLASTISPEWNASISLNFNTVAIQNRSKNQTSGFNLRASNRSLNNKLNSSLTYGLANAQASNVHTINFQSSYPITTSSAASLSIRTSIFQGKGPNASTFREMTASFSYSYRF